MIWRCGTAYVRVIRVSRTYPDVWMCNLMDTKGVFLWCSPRCISTGFECCIRQLPNVKVLHEPFAAARYLGPERKSSQFSHMPPDDSKSFASIAKEIEDSITCGKYEAVFGRDMAYHMEDYFPQSGIMNCKHSFLIRHPAHTLFSLYKRCLTDDNLVFGPNAGFKQQYEVYQLVKDKLNDPSPVVLDISDVLMDPEGMMQVYCEAVGLTYKPGMTSWSSYFTIASLSCSFLCDTWHEQLLKTKGLEKSTKEKPLPSDKELPEEVKKLIKEHLPYYEALYAVRLKPKESHDI